MECAINRATKEKRVAELTEALENSDVAFAVRYNKISVKNFEAFRRALPADAKMYVAKNTLMKQAVSRVSGSIPLVQQHQDVQLLLAINLTAGCCTLSGRCMPNLKKSITVASAQRDVIIS